MLRQDWLINLVFHVLPSVVIFLSGIKDPQGSIYDLILDLYFLRNIFMNFSVLFDVLGRFRYYIFHTVELKFSDLVSLNLKRVTYL